MDIDLDTFQKQFCVAVYNNNEDRVRELLAVTGHTRNINFRDICSKLLLRALHYLSTAMISLLLDRGGDINPVDSSMLGNTLGIAIFYRRQDIVSLLLDRGVDINAICSKYGSALDTAAYWGYRDIISLLLSRGADINTVGGECGSALATAAYRGHQDIFLLLLDRGANINAVGGNYGSALGTAAYRRYWDIVSLLLDRGADINAMGGIYGSALGTATWWGDQQYIISLLDRGADINTVGGRYGSALAAAAYQGHQNTVLLLLDRGADINAVGGIYGSALGTAAYRGHQDIVSLLLDRGADINTVGGELGSALAAAAHQEHQNIVLLLLDRGADINAVGGIYGSALAAAAFRGHEDITSLLLDRGADINTVGGGFGSALAAAAFRGHQDIISLLLNRGANINTVGGELGSALAAAAHQEHQHIISLLLDRGADINAVGGIYGSALGTAAHQGHRDIALLLLDRGADINAVDGIYGSALAAAFSQGHQNTVLLLLDRGADINTVDGKYESALAAAAYQGHQDIISLLLDRGADINAVDGKYGSALAAAAYRGHQDIASLLLGRGADINAVDGKYGSALAAAAYRGHQDIASLLLDRGADINAVDSKYGSALAAALYQGHQHIISLLLDRGADINTLGGECGSALAAAAYWGYQDIVLLLLDRGADINVMDGIYGSVLGTAAHQGHRDILLLLLDRGADINAVDGKYGSALAAAAYRGHQDIVSLLLGRGADINAVDGKYGSALGIAVYHGHQDITSMLLDQGADVIFVGGRYDTVYGEYPTAVHAAQSGQLQPTPGLFALVEGALQKELKAMGEAADLVHRPPFPMPHTPVRVESTSASTAHQCYLQVPASCASKPPAPTDAHSNQLEFHLGGNITPEQSDILCKDLNKEVLIHSLVTLVGIHNDVAERLRGWIQNDIQYFVSQNFDLGIAYAAARVGWRHFNKLAPAMADLKISQQRSKWLKRAKELHEERGKAIYTDSKAQELIKSPYSVMPRRVWDLKSNRIVAYHVLHAEAQPHRYPYPPFWAVTHSWTASMDAVVTSINQYQWPVPFPSGAELESLRAELLNFGAEYVWIDVLCLRQQSSTPAFEKIRQDEWRIDVPTIGNIYRAAERLVRYFNGLGRPFSKDGWDDPRHWLRRAWTLQEISTENMTFNGGMPQIINTQHVIMNIKGKVGGKNTTLRRALRPVLMLTAELDSSGGFGMYQLIREMARRYASQPTDKVAVLLYLLRTAQLPTYKVDTSAELAWTQCFHVLRFRQQIEILFDFPYRGTEQQWFPTWKQIMEWPERDSDYQHSRAQWISNDEQSQELQNLGSTPLGIQEGGGFYTSNVLALSHVSLDPLNELEYVVQSGGKFFAFYCPYVSARQQINTTSQQYTLIALKLGHSFNWMVCDERGEDELHGQDDNGKKHVVQVKVLKKLGVLRTDSSSEILVWGIDKRGSLLTTINCLVV